MGNGGTAPDLSSSRIPPYSRGWAALGSMGQDNGDRFKPVPIILIDIIPPQPNLQPPGEEEFESIVGFVQEHRLKDSDE